MQSEKQVAQTTKPIASGPAFSCTQRDTPLRFEADSGSELPAMKPATQAMRVQREHERVAVEHHAGSRARPAASLKPGIR